jgi:cyclin-dependent kinase 10
MADTAGVQRGRGAIAPEALAAAVATGGVERFEKLGRIGEGTYGVVYRARDRATGELVALKKVRMDRERDGMPVTSLREMRLLRESAHPHIVRLRAVVSGARADAVFLVFDYAEHDLAALLDAAAMQRAPPPFSASEVKTLLLQLLSAVAFLHARCVLHRDLKLSNLLYTNAGMLKLADFGLARNASPVAGSGALTPRVVTLWYRAPELLLGCTQYGTPVDAWAAGCILGELLRREPLFPGTDEAETWRYMVALLGTPTERIWPGWSRLPRAGSVAGGAASAAQNFNFLKRDFPDVSPAGIELLNQLLTYDPRKRAGAAEAAAHAWFSERPLPRQPAAMPRFPCAHGAPPPPALPDSALARKRAREEQQQPARR